MTPPSTTTPVIIIGAGAAGLATAARLQQRGVPTLILEAADIPGATWAALYDSLHLHTIKAFTAFPGYPLPRHWPRYVTRDQLMQYHADYAAHFGLAIVTGCRVLRAAHDGVVWQLETTTGPYTAEVLISATGNFVNPTLVTFPGQAEFGGEILHVAAYKNVAPFIGKRVLIVGAGNSSGDVAVELAAQGVQPLVAVRDGVNLVPNDLLWLPTQFWGIVMAAVPLWLARFPTWLLLSTTYGRQRRAHLRRHSISILDRQKTMLPIIGWQFLRAVERGAITIVPNIREFTPTGVILTDGRAIEVDVVILATGYRHALGYLATPVTLDANGDPMMVRQRSSELPDLYFVGINHDMRGPIFNIRGESLTVARQVQRWWRRRAKQQRQARHAKTPQPLPIAEPTPVHTT